MATPIAPLTEIQSWNREVDIVVVGLGAAGACAALEAHRAGVDVLIIERASGGGGASAQSEGIFYLGGGTSLQRDLGYDDSPENMYAFMRASTSAPDDAILRQFCDDAAGHFDWLESNGVPFDRRAFTGKAVAVRTGEGLLSTGNEKVWPFIDAAQPVPRGHQTRADNGDRGGINAMAALLATVEREGIPTQVDTAVTGLVMQDSTVVGVRLRTPGAPDEFVGARRGVIMATGSFNLNDEMTKDSFPIVAEHARPLGIDSNDGAGLLLAQGAGAATEAMEGVIATGSIYPPAQLIFGIIVNAEGQRFVAEDSYHGRTAHFIARQPEQRAWLLVDEEHFAYPERGHPLVDVFDDVDALETSLGVPPGSITDTLERYNAGASDGTDTEFHKHRDWLTPLQFPLAAFNISMAVAEYSFIALGGLRADLDGRALTEDGTAIDGLYAVGAVAAHLPRDGDEYASGMSLGPGSYFGRRAGRHAAARI